MNEPYPKAVQVHPSSRQLAWQQLEYIGFAHFGINTFTDREWGDGTEDPALFQPSAFDADQWAETCRDAGMKMLILTAKHHDGFCLWPSQQTKHSVQSSPWRDGAGDVVAEVSAACARAGLKFGVYCSPWDRHEPTYGDSPAYNSFFRAQLCELLSNYGEIGEVWFDGACAEGPNGKRQEYDWTGYYEDVRRLQPEAVIAICGPDVRWVGNESGLARDDEWSVLPASATDQTDIAANFLDFDAQSGQIGSREQLQAAQRLIWYPAECDVSIRPGWFYHASEDLQVKSTAHLLDIYYRSVGRNSLLLLNVPPDKRGLIHEHDASRLRELRRVLDTTFADDLTEGAQLVESVDVDTAADTTAETVLELKLAGSRTFDRLLLQEDITLGQRIEGFTLEAWHDDAWKLVVRGKCVGYKRLECFGRVTADCVRLRVEQTRGPVQLKRLGLFCQACEDGLT